MVINLIIKGNSSDRLTEARRGKIYHAHSPEMEDLKEDPQSRYGDDDECTKDDIDIIDQGLDTVEYLLYIFVL